MCEHVNMPPCDEALPLISAEPAAALFTSVRETELEFYSRRAMEEARAARRTLQPEAAAAHRYLAAAYAALVAKETEAETELEDLARQIP
jgi:hypothetical protein